jgi:hypothetical protein
MATTHIITPSLFPMVWDAIVAHASVPTLFALRATSHELRDLVDGALLAHIEARGPYDETCSNFGDCRAHNVHTFPAWGLTTIGSVSRRHRYVRPDGTLRFRLPYVDTPRTLQLRHKSTLLDIDYLLDVVDLRALSHLAEPDLLRVKPMAPGHREYYHWDPSAKHLEIIHARVAILSLAHGIEPRFYDEDGLVTLPDRTQRLVLHQHNTGIRARYLHLHSAALRELVLVFVPKPGPHGIESYLEALLPAVPNAAITVVGLGACEMDSLGETLMERINLRTLEEHRQAIGEAQWAQEMEL